MKVVKHLVVSFVFNLIAILATAYLIPGFTINDSVESFVIVAMSLTLINTFLKPVIKLILTPLIILTLGLFTVIINALLLYGLDIFLTSLRIEGLTPLFYATILISVINLVLHFFDKKLHGKA